MNWAKRYISKSEHERQHSGIEHGQVLVKSDLSGMLQRIAAGPHQLFSDGQDALTPFGCRTRCRIRGGVCGVGFALHSIAVSLRGCGHLIADRSQVGEVRLCLLE